MKVLVIEDSKFYQHIFKNFLSRHNIEHDIVDQGAYAQEALYSKDYDYVFLDLKLPDVSGLEILSEFADLQNTKFIPITGYENEIQKVDSEPYEYEQRIKKPFSEEELILCLEEHLDTKLINNSNDFPEETEDLEKIESIINQNNKLNKKLIKIFKKDLNKKIKSLLKNYKNEEYLHVGNCLHQLKSNCRYFGFYNFADKCENIEKQITSEFDSNIPGMISELVDRVDVLIKIIDQASSKWKNLDSKSI